MAKAIHRIDKILRKTLRKMDLDNKLEGYRVWPLWSEIVGEQIARKTQPERFRNRILFVRVSSSTWMQQLQTMKPLLLERIHRTVKGGFIKDIRFCLGKVDPLPSPLPTPQRPDPPMETLCAEMEASLDHIQDGELRALVRGLMLKQGKRVGKNKEN